MVVELFKLVCFLGTKRIDRFCSLWKGVSAYLLGCINQCYQIKLEEKFHQ